MAKVFAENAATEVFSTDDPDEGEAFVVARRFCIPAVEAKGSLLLEDVGCRFRRWAGWSPGSRPSPPNVT